MMKKTISFLNEFVLKVRIVVGILIGYPYLAFADGPQNIGTVAAAITTSFMGVAQFMTGFSYLGGLGFVLASILKFKAHRDNPTQIPIGTPVMLLGVGASLMFLPTIFKVAGATVFGSANGTGGLTGVSSF